MRGEVLLSELGERLHAVVVLELPLARRGYVLVVEEAAAALRPADGLGLGEAVKEHGVVGEELEAEPEEGRVECEPEAPVDLHFINY